MMLEETEPFGNSSGVGPMYAPDQEARLYRERSELFHIQAGSAISPAARATFTRLALVYARLADNTQRQLTESRRRRLLGGTRTQVFDCYFRA